MAVLRSSQLLFYQLHSLLWHLQLSCLVADWSQAGLRAKMAACGIKFSPWPWPPPLMSLPYRWMVLSAVMVSMWHVTCADPTPLIPPITWVKALSDKKCLPSDLFSWPPWELPDLPTLVSEGAPYLVASGSSTPLAIPLIGLLTIPALLRLLPLLLLQWALFMGLLLYWQSPPMSLTAILALLWLLPLQLLLWPLLLGLLLVWQFTPVGLLASPALLRPLPLLLLQ